MIRNINPVALDGDPQIKYTRMAHMKTRGTPAIVICVPCGNKDVHTLFKCEEDKGGCGTQWVQGGKALPNVVAIRWMLGFIDLQMPLNTTVNYLFESGRLSAEARQIMTKEALRAQCDYILYWDDDVVPPVFGLTVLYNYMQQNPEIGAVTGVYTTRTDTPHEPLVYKDHGKGAFWDFQMGPGAEPVPILGAGAGFLLARASAVIDTIDKYKADNGGVEVPIWADEMTFEDRKTFWGHDLRFCRMLQECGHPVYVHGEVLCGHYDMDSGQMFTVPEDRLHTNTTKYWNQIYGHAGADHWNKHYAVYERVLEEIPNTDTVTELGCGTGMLGSMLTAKKGVRYKGYEISDVAIDIAKARFLDVDKLDLRDITSEYLKGKIVLAVEVLEHLDAEVWDRVFDAIEASDAVRVVFTVPNDCMGPDTVAEHCALFNEALIRARLATRPLWTLSIKPIDESRLICTMDR